MTPFYETPQYEEWMAEEIRQLSEHLMILRELAKRMDVDLGVVLQLRLLGGISSIIDIQKKPMKIMVPKDPEEEWKANG